MSLCPIKPIFDISGEAVIDVSFELVLIEMEDIG